jgi:hypothetical protein
MKSYTNNDDCPCGITKKSQMEFSIISIYANDLYIIGSPKDIDTQSPKEGVQDEGLGKTKYFLGLQLDTFPHGF